MNTEEKTKKEKKTKKEREEEKEQLEDIEQKVRLKSSTFAKAIGGLFCFVIIFIEDVFFDNLPIAGCAAFSIFFAMAAAESLYRFMFMKKTFDIVKGVAFAIFCIAFIISFVALLIKQAIA